jgi:hypothetical protein
VLERAFAGFNAFSRNPTRICKALICRAVDDWRRVEGGFFIASTTVASSAATAFDRRSMNGK